LSCNKPPTFISSVCSISIIFAFFELLILYFLRLIAFDLTIISIVIFGSVLFLLSLINLLFLEMFARFISRDRESYAIFTEKEMLKKC